MNNELFEVLDNIYTKRDAKWIRDVSINDSYIILKFLSMDSKLTKQVRWLNNYAFHLDAKMFISMAWSVVPKVSRRPYCPYISKTKSVSVDVDKVLQHWRQHLKLSDNDYIHSLPYMKPVAQKFTKELMAFYGIDKTIKINKGKKND